MSYELRHPYGEYDTNLHLQDTTNNIDYLIDTSDYYDVFDDIFDTDADVDTLIDMAWRIKPIESVIDECDSSRYEDDEKLRALVDKICSKYFDGSTLFGLLGINSKCDIDIKFNKRLKTVGGRFRISGNESLFGYNDLYWCIEINPMILKKHDELINTVKHELCHYFVAKAGFNPTHGSPLFTQMVNLCGCKKHLLKPLVQYKYKCLHCEKVLTLHHRLNKRNGVLPYTHNCNDGADGQLERIE